MGQLRAARADGDVLGAEARHAEQMRVESRELLAAVDVAERGGIARRCDETPSGSATISIDRRGRSGSGAAWFTQPPPNEITSSGFSPMRQDVLPLGHLHDVADGRRAGPSAAYQLGQRRVRDVGHRGLMISHVRQPWSVVRCRLTGRGVGRRFTTQPGCALTRCAMSVTDALRQDVKGAVRGLWKSPGSRSRR